MSPEGVDWDSELGEPPRERLPVQELAALRANGDTARALVEATGWAVHPIAYVPQGPGKGYKKQPLTPWTTASTRDPDEARALFEAHPGACVGVDLAKSGAGGLILVDVDVAVVPEPWLSALNECPTLVFASVTRGGPHYVYAQPSDGTLIGNGVWPGGDVRGVGGFMALSHRPPIQDLPVVEPTGRLLQLLREHIGEPRAPRTRTPAGLVYTAATAVGGVAIALASRERAVELSAASSAIFLDTALKKFWNNVAAGDHRRTAALKASHHMMLEAAAGYYSALDAYAALRDAYERSREDDAGSRGGDGFTPARARDLDTMWLGMAELIERGDYDVQVAELEGAIGVVAPRTLELYEEWVAARLEAGREVARAIETGEPLRGGEDPVVGKSAGEGSEDLTTAERQETAPSGVTDPWPSASDGPRAPEPVEAGPAVVAPPMPEDFERRVKEAMLRLEVDRVAREQLGELEVARLAIDPWVQFDFDGDPPELTPLDCLVRTDGQGLASVGHHAHLIAGTRSSGKSWLIQYLVLEQARLGRRVAYLDWEMNGRDVFSRFKALGADRGLNDLVKYFSMSGRPIQAAILALEAWEPDLVCVDSVARALGAEPRKPADWENSSSHFVEWVRHLDRVRAGASLFLIDHTGHLEPGRPRGASAKLDQVDFGYTLDVVTPWHRTGAGSAVLTPRKSRAGELLQDEPCALMRVAPSDGGRRVEVRLEPPSAGTSLALAAAGVTAENRETRARVAALMADGETRSKNEIQRVVKGSRARVIEVIDRMVDEGLLEPTGGGSQSGFRVRGGVA